MSRRVLVLTLALACVAGVAEAAKRAGLKASEATIRPAAAGQPTTAAYLTLTNPTARAEKLLGVECDCAAEVQAHQTLDDQGVMRMRPAGEVLVPAHGAVSFKPGGLHLMVMGLKRAVPAGETVSMTLRFAHAAPITVKFDVRR